MIEVDQFAVLRKLRNRMGCDSFSALSRKLGSDESAISRIKLYRTAIPPSVILNAATVLDVSPKKLMSDVGIPEDYFFERRRGHQC